MITASQMARSAWWVVGAQALAERRQRGAGDVLDVALAALEALDLSRIGVEADDFVAGLGKRNGERQADVAESDDSDLHSARSLFSAQTARRGGL